MEGKYIYCLIQSNHQKKFGPLGIGERADELTTVSYRDISAVVSNCSLKEFTVSRQNTMAHEKAIEKVMKEHPVLPVRFSTVADSSEEIVEKVLAPRYDEFKKLLAWIANKEEIGVKARWLDMNQVFKEIAEGDERIKKLKERIARKGTGDAAYYEKIDLGKLVEAKLKEKKEQEKEKIIGVLKEKACDYKINPVYGDDIILSSAFLVKKAGEKDFFSLVSSIQEGYGSKLQLKYVTGPPPFNFVNIVIKL